MSAKLSAISIQVRTYMPVILMSCSYILFQILSKVLELPASTIKTYSNILCCITVFKVEGNLYHKNDKFEKLLDCHHSWPSSQPCPLLPWVGPLPATRQHSQACPSTASLAHLHSGVLHQYAIEQCLHCIASRGYTHPREGDEGAPRDAI